MKISLQVLIFILKVHMEQSNLILILPNLSNDDLIFLNSFDVFLNFEIQ